MSEKPDWRARSREVADVARTRGREAAKETDERGRKAAKATSIRGRKASKVARRRGRQAGKVAGDGALIALHGALSIAQWLYENTEVGPREPIADGQPGETLNDYMRRKRYDEMGANYGPHDDLEEQAYTQNWRGDLKPYEPRRRK